MRATVLGLVLIAGLAQAAPKKVSLELSNADVQSVLRLFAQIGRFNLITSDEVNGKVTLTLRNVPWNEAFEVVLATKGLGAERIGSIVRVAPLARLAEEAALRARTKAAEQASRPLKVTLIPVNNAPATELAAQVKAMLSPRGTVSVDVRTNTLIVRDVDD